MIQAVDEEEDEPFLFPNIFEKETFLLTMDRIFEGPRCSL